MISEKRKTAGVAGADGGADLTKFGVDIAIAMTAQGPVATVGGAFLRVRAEGRQFHRRRRRLRRRRIGSFRADRHGLGCLRERREDRDPGEEGKDDDAFDHDWIWASFFRRIEGRAVAMILLG